MSLFDTIIGRQQLQSLPPEMQDQARTEARREFWINTLLGGRGLASGLQGARQVVPQMQQGLQQQRIGQAIDRSMVPQDPTNIGLTQTGPGSQADMLAQENAAFGLDPTVQQRTVEALQRNPNLPRQLDPRALAENMAPLIAGSDPSKAISLFQSTAPVFDPTTGTMRDPMTGQLVGSIEQEGRTPGTVTRVDPTTGAVSFRAGTGAREAIEDARPIDLAQGEEIIGRTPDGRVIIQNAIGAVYARGERERATAEGQAFGQETQRFNPVTQQMEIVSRAEALGLTGGRAGGPGAGGAGAGGRFAAGPTEAQKTLDAASRQLFEKTGNEIIERARLSNERLFQSEEAYNAAERIDPNALTSVAGALTPWLRLIPGFGDSLAQFGTDFSLLRQRHSRGILRQFEGGAAKGNLNDREVRLFQTASWQMNDPKEIIQYIAATESALADKDLARLRFYEQYIADGNNPAQFNTAWENAPENIRVYDHDMFVRFLNDRVRDSFNKPVDKDGRHPPPVLPPGHKIVEDERTGRLGIRNPDGRVLPLDF